MPKTQQTLYEMALSKMAIPTCECLLDEPDDLHSINNDKDIPHDTDRTTRTRTLLAEAQNKVPRNTSRLYQSIT